MSRPPNDKEILAVHMSRRDLCELIDTLRQAEELCDSLRHKSQDFRMQRVRLEVLRTSSVPPPPTTRQERLESTRYIATDDLRAGRKKGG